MTLTSYGNLGRASGRCLSLARRGALACKQPFDGDVFIETLPMQASRTELDLSALFGCRVHQTREPRDRHRDDASIQPSLEATHAAGCSESCFTTVADGGNMYRLSRTAFVGVEEEAAAAIAEHDRHGK